MLLLELPAGVKRRALHLAPDEMEKEHLAHKGAIAVRSIVLKAFGATDSSCILFVIIATWSGTKVTLVGRSVTVNRSSMSRNASEHMLFICTCASGYMWCLANTKGIAVISSNSVTVLGSIAGALPPPLFLPPANGVAEAGAAAVLPTIVTCTTLSKKWDRNKFLQDAIFQMWSDWMMTRRVCHCLWIFTTSSTNHIPAKKHAGD